MTNKILRFILPLISLVIPTQGHAVSDFNFIASEDKEQAIEVTISFLLTRQLLPGV